MIDSTKNKNLPVRFTDEQKKRLAGVASSRGHKFQWLIENFLEWYAKTGRTPWTEREASLNPGAPVIEQLTYIESRNPSLAEALRQSITEAAREVKARADQDIANAEKAVATDQRRRQKIAQAIERPGRAGGAD